MNGKKNETDNVVGNITPLRHDPAPQCTVASWRNGVLYRCTKARGHENNPLDIEHVARATEYAYRNWQVMFEEARPLLEHIVSTQPDTPQANTARKLLIKAYLSTSTRPGVVKTKLQVAS